MEENLTPDFPIFCTSSLKDSVSPATAHLVAAYTANLGAPVIDDAEEIFIIWPEFLSSIAGINALMVYIIDVKFTLIRFSSSSSLLSSIYPV